MSRHTTLMDLEGVLEQLVERRGESLRLLLVAPVYEPMLRALLERIRGLTPRRGSGARPLAAELAEADGLHDGLGTAVWFLLSAYQVHPTLGVDVKALASSLMASFIAERAELRASYLDEAQAARVRVAAVEERRAELERFPVIGGTLEGWVQDFVAAGLRIHALLEQRAEAEGAPRGDSTEAVTLRNEVVGVLARFRMVVRDEVQARPTLPRDLETRLFAFYDLVQSLRQKEPRPTPPEPTEGPGPGDVPEP